MKISLIRYTLKKIRCYVEHIYSSETTHYIFQLDFLLIKMYVIISNISATCLCGLRGSDNLDAILYSDFTLLFRNKCCRHSLKIAQSHNVASTRRHQDLWSCHIYLQVHLGYSGSSFGCVWPTTSQKSIQPSAPKSANSYWTNKGRRPLFTRFETRLFE